LKLHRVENHSLFPSVSASALLKGFFCGANAPQIGKSLRKEKQLMQNTLRGLTGGIVLIALALGILLGKGNYFLPLFFAGLALAALLGSFSTVDAKGIYGGFQGFIWLLGLAVCFLPWVGFWPWILVVAGVSAILGALAAPIVNGLQAMGWFGGIPMANRQRSSQPYQEYQQPQPTYQEGGQQYPYPGQDS
jgi:hypothetical protein